MSLRQRTVCDISKKIQIGYGKIVANRGKYNRRALAKLYSTFCDHSVLYASSLLPPLNNDNLKRIRINYFKFCKFLLYLPPWTKYRTLVRTFSIPDITLKLEILHRKISSTASARLSPHHRLIRFFVEFVCVFVFLFVFFYIYSYSTIFTLCIVWVKNKINK